MSYCGLRRILPWSRLAILAALLSARGIFAQQNPTNSAGADLAQLYSQGMAEFQAGDYVRAATDLEALY